MTHFEESRRRVGSELGRWFGTGSVRHGVHTVHRTAAAVTGAGLGLFGLAGLLLAGGLGMDAGAVVLGLYTNATLSILSLTVAALLLGAAVRGGPAASSTMVVLGPLFLVSGVGNALVIGTPLDMLAFQAGDVIFSLVAGAALILLGAYGRLTGGLPADNPYARRRRPADAVRPTGRPAATGPVRDEGSARVLAAALADAERAVTRHTASGLQLRAVAAAGTHRSHDLRLTAFDRVVTRGGGEAPAATA